MPSSWRRYRCRDLPVGVWIVDLAKRLSQLAAVGAAPDLAKVPVALGLLFHPHGFITASRQAVAHATQSSLEELGLEVALEETGQDNSFVVEGASPPCLLSHSPGSVADAPLTLQASLSSAPACRTAPSPSTTARSSASARRPSHGGARPTRRPRPAPATRRASRSRASSTRRAPTSCSRCRSRRGASTPSRSSSARWRSLPQSKEVWRALVSFFLYSLSVLLAIAGSFSFPGLCALESRMAAFSS